MSYSRVGRSTSPCDYFSPGRDPPSRSLSRSRHSRSRSNSVKGTNPGNNLYGTGLSTRVDTSDPEKQFSERKMSYVREGRSSSPRDYFSPDRGRPLTRSRRSRSRSKSPNATNPGNNLYVTGLSTRVGTTDLEKYFGSEGKVLECQLVTDPHTRESRGFGFVTMENVDAAERCIKYLNRSVFEGRLITVEKAKRKRGRTPTPGRYQGLRDTRGQGRRRSRSYSPRRRQDRDTGYSRVERRGRSPPPYHGRADDYSNSYRRHDDRHR